MPVRESVGAEKDWAMIRVADGPKIVIWNYRHCSWVCLLCSALGPCSRLLVLWELPICFFSNQGGRMAQRRRISRKVQ